MRLAKLPPRPLRLEPPLFGAFAGDHVGDLLEQNVPREDVQHLAGHADPERLVGLGRLRLESEFSQIIYAPAAGA